MHQFFTTEDRIAGNIIHLAGREVGHIRNVLRMRLGENVRISTEHGKAYFCHIQEIQKDEVLLLIDSEDMTGTELPNSIYLFQGLPKGDKMELIIQKATELGVSFILPVAMRNCVVKLDGQKAQSRQKRWQAIADSAAAQSKRTVIPQVQTPCTMEEAMAVAQTLDTCFMAYENERGMTATRQHFSRIQKGQRIGVFVGPEGGFSEQEVTALTGCMTRISLGKRILRTETAGIAVLSMLVYQLEE